MGREAIQLRYVGYSIMRVGGGYSIPDDVDGGVVEYNCIFLPPNSQYGRVVLQRK